MNNRKIQRDFFDAWGNQYSTNLILKPPLHTQLEISSILNRLKKIDTELVIDFGAGSGRITVPLLQTGYSVLQLISAINLLII